VPATSVHARFPHSHLSGPTHVCKWGCPDWKRVASERAKRTLWLVAATKLVCPLLPGRLCEGAEIRSPAEIIGKKCYNRHFASGGRAFYEQCWTGEGTIPKQKQTARSHWRHFATRRSLSRRTQKRQSPARARKRVQLVAGTQDVAYHCTASVVSEAWGGSASGITVTGEIQSTPRKPCPSDIFHMKWPGIQPGLPCRRPATSRLIKGTVQNDKL